MGIYLSVNHISKTYGVHRVLDDISFILNNGERLGLVGANGVGKTTLLKILTGELEADGGQVFLTPRTSLGYLKQELEVATLINPHPLAPSPPSSEGGSSSLSTKWGGDLGVGMNAETISDLIASALAHLHELEGQMRDLEDAMATASNEALDAILMEYQTVTEAYERAGGYTVEYRLNEVLHGLGIAHISQTRLVNSLSGGEKARFGLAMLLLQGPDVLLLDEPTNHLDVRALEWLEEYLAAYPGGVLTVSHDRQFLNRTVTAIIEIDEHSRTINHYAGNYDAYLVAKAQARLKWEQEYVRQQEEIKELRIAVKTTSRQVAHNRPASDGDKFLKHFKRAQVENAISSRVHRAEEKLRRLEADAVPRPPEELRFAAEFDPSRLEGQTPLFASSLYKAYGEQAVLENVSLTLGARSRIALVGPNGAGKSTLLKILAGIETADAGEIYINPQVKIGYLDQEGHDLDPSLTVLEAYRSPSPPLRPSPTHWGGVGGGDDQSEQQAIATLITSGLFRYDDMARRVSELSSGQRRKLQIARLIASRANLLLLDEPTNYVSFDVLESLERALQDFPGPIIAASHDRRFLQQFDGEVWEISDGHLIERVWVG